MEKLKSKDALGNPIIIGNDYGYAFNKNGHNQVSIGKILRETTENKVTMRVYNSYHSIYNDNLKPEERKFFSVSVKSIMLFPINNPNYELRNN